MKLKNKKTGEIIDVYKGQVLLHYDNGRKTMHFKSLEELEKWEDVPEEPKEYWYVGWSGEVCCSEVHDEMTNQMKLIGNYFETKEEAEKALEKLKAWKRLKDKGFRFETVNFDRQMVTKGRVNLMIKATFNDEHSKDVFNLSDLDLIFGGGE